MMANKQENINGFDSEIVEDAGSLSEGQPINGALPQRALVNGYDAKVVTNANGGLPLTPEQQETLLHFKYNPETNKLEGDRSIETTFNSFFLKDVHRISSGGDTIFFTELNNNISYYPARGGIKDQSIFANQDASGLVNTTANLYSNDLDNFDVYGLPAPSGSVPYARASMSIPNQSIFGQQIIVEEAINPSDWIFYEIYIGNDLTGKLVYDQKLTGLNLSAGDTFTWWFSNPVEDRNVTPIFSTMSKSDSEDGVKTTLNVRPSISIPDAHYVKAYFRDFENNNLKFQGELFKTNGDISNSIDFPTFGETLFNYTCNQSGTYKVDLSASFNVNATNRSAIIEIQVNGVPVKGQEYSKELKDATNIEPFSLFSVIDLVDGDLLEIKFGPETFGTTVTFIENSQLEISRRQI